MLSTELSTSLDFDKVVENLSRYFLAEDSKQKFIQTRPCKDFTELSLVQKQVLYFQDCIQQHSFPNKEILKSLTPLFLHCRKRDLHVDEIILLSNSIANLQYYVQWFRESKYAYVKTERFPQHLFQSLSFYFDENGELRIHKIPELKRLYRTRREIQKQRSKLADEFIKNNANLCQSEQASFRDEKILVSIKSSFRSQVDGSIYASSASKETVYMELNSIRTQNNKMKELFYEEQKILYEICKNLSLVFQKEHSSFEKFYQDFLCFDIIQAQYKYGLELKAQIPSSFEFSDNSTKDLILLKDACHPLVSKANPITIRMSKTTKQLILTGANGGGKTFALKTLGLLVLMHQSGIPIPVSDGSQLPFISDLAVVIGDEQNIHKALSTFSAHLHAIKSGMNTLSTNDQKTLRLFLIDEICSDTDDREGGALAWAILENLASKNIVVVLSTHLALLKQYAISSPIAEIACIDPEGLKNKHSIVYGLIGISEVERCARQVGLAPTLINRHLSLLKEHGKEHHDYLKTLNSLIQNWKEKQSNLISKEQAIQEKEVLLHETEKNLMEKEILLKERGIIELQELLSRMRKALEKSQEIHSELEQRNAGLENNAEIEQSKRRIDKNDILNLRNEAKIISKNIQEFQNKSEKQKQILEKEQIFRKSDEVLLKKSKHQGIVEKVLANNYYIILVGILNVKVHGTELCLLENKVESSQKRVSYVLEKMENELSYSLDLRGYRVDEAITLIDKNIDTAIIRGLSSFSVIHGKGEGTLRQAVQKHLASHTAVKNYYFSRQNEGGFGNTRVILAQ